MITSRKVTMVSQAAQSQWRSWLKRHRRIERALVTAIPRATRVDQVGSGAFDGPEQLVELEVQGAVVTVLGVLEDDHEQERDDREPGGAVPEALLAEAASADKEGHGQGHPEADEDGPGRTEDAR